jgi:hypothetical protein
MKNKILTSSVIIAIAIFTTGCSQSQNQVQLNKITSNICKTNIKSSSPWHISNLYDCKDKSFFIPYQLWSGAKYDGNKANSKNHQANMQTQTPFQRRGKIRYTPLSITGTTKWYSDEFDKEFNIYTRLRGSKTQYFVANDMGIGRVYDSRYNGGRYYSGTNIKFPAGYGWKLNTPRGTTYEMTKNMGLRTRTTTIEIIDMIFTSSNELESISFKWYPRGNYLDHIYTYIVGLGMQEAKKQ